MFSTLERLFWAQSDEIHQYSPLQENYIWPTTTLQNRLQSQHFGFFFGLSCWLCLPPPPRQRDGCGSSFQWERTGQPHPWAHPRIHIPKHCQWLGVFGKPAPAIFPSWIALNSSKRGPCPGIRKLGWDHAMNWALVSGISVFLSKINTLKWFPAEDPPENAL